ncbi:MAG: hypothetical protein QOI24_1513 [Acidobacteriota bacterium]|jgi:hypothetical protein|nr:hypothetical protein [Acidobacteriota bacterium]
MNNGAEKSILTAAVTALRDLGFVVSVSAATVIIRRGTQSWRYRGEIKKAVGPVIGHIALAFSRDAKKRLLITDHVTPQVADELRRREIQFVDADGNAFLQRRGLFVFVNGRRRTRPVTTAKPVRVFQPSGLRTTFALLSVPDLISAPQRSIALAAGVALGSVAHVLEGLRELGFVARVRGELRLTHRDRLIRQWTEAYARMLEPSLEIGRFSAPSRRWWRHAKIATLEAKWGGETAVAILKRQLTPERTIVYVMPGSNSLLSKQRLRANPDGDVFLRRRFWNFEVPNWRPDIVPPLLVYADLLASGDARSLAAAEQIRGEYLD